MTHHRGWIKDRWCPFNPALSYAWPSITDTPCNGIIIYRKGYIDKMAARLLIYLYKIQHGRTMGFLSRFIQVPFVFSNPYTCWHKEIIKLDRRRGIFYLIKMTDLLASINSSVITNRFCFAPTYVHSSLVDSIWCSFNVPIVTRQKGGRGTTNMNLS